MRFGKTLRQSIYAPWKDKYIDYAKLKSLLREDKYDDDDVPWTAEDENRFCDEIFNVQLEKVAEFQQTTVNQLRERTDAAFEHIKEATPLEGQATSEITTKRLNELEAELDSITNEISELKRFSNVNYTAFLKIVKKHDRKRGENYRVRPMMQLSLAKRPFNSEQGYSPLLNKLSLMYYGIRQQLDSTGEDQPRPDLENTEETHNGERYTAHKFWVHPDNLLEVKTYILRRLPALVYSSQSAKSLDVADDPTITSLYFDNKNFGLYSDKVDRQSEATSLRVRWYGQLSSQPELSLEQKTVGEQGTREEKKITIKQKHMQSFLDGTFNLDKTVQKMKRQSHSAQVIEDFKQNVTGLQTFIGERSLQPVLRANYVRSAFQKPNDDRVRISLDTEVAFVREDTIDRQRPCRDPSSWHRLEIDDRGLSYPFKDINKSEVSLFPYAILEIKLKDDTNRKRPVWVSDLIGSHLVHPAPRFSKFVHGVASLFEDYVNNLPFWLSDLEGDIRKDPQKAFEDEERRRSQKAEDEVAVGSFLGKRVSQSHRQSRDSPLAQSYLSERLAAESQSSPAEPRIDERTERAVEEDEEDEEGSQQQQQQQQQPQNYGTLSSIIPGFSLSRYSLARRHERQRDGQDALPEGVVEPMEWSKNMGELKIEPKVWLANERTFLKWQHICILLGSLAVSLYTAAGEDTVAEAMGIVYILIAIFAGAWGYGMMHVRRRMIIERSGKDFDNNIGPLAISIAMMVALILNLIFAYRKVFDHWDGKDAVFNASTAELYGQEL